MKINIFNLLFLLAFFVFQGCSFKENFEPNANSSKSQNNALNENLDYNKIYNNLLTQYKNWEGVRYKYGGYSKNGIDCSAFVQKTFKEKLDINLPRTTSLQLEIGEEINLEDLVTGDLIFFKTGFKTNHVGIYLKNGKFMHVSTKKGVIISNLDNPYFRKHIWKIKRVIY